jgi:hypothetical protein
MENISLYLIIKNNIRLKIVYVNWREGREILKLEKYGIEKSSKN